MAQRKKNIQRSEEETKNQRILIQSDSSLKIDERQDISEVLEQDHSEHMPQEEMQILRLLLSGTPDNLKQHLQSQPPIDLTSIWDRGGFSILHQAVNKNSLPFVQVLVNYASELELSAQRRTTKLSVTEWINHSVQQGDEGFTCLHFAAFNGNLEMLRFLISNGGDIKKVQQGQKVNLFMVAAQGDSPGVMAFLKKELNDPSLVNTTDQRGATALHWACYAGSENAIQYLLAWGVDPNIQDYSGITPLHLAVKAAEESRSSRSVRMLLIKGAGRKIKDRQGRRPIDLAFECKNATIRKEILGFLEEPNVLQKCMIQTPMQKTQRTMTSVIIFITLYFFSFVYFLLYINSDPFTNQSVKVFLIGNFFITTVLFLLSWLSDPGYLKPSPNIDFIDIIPQFDPGQLCADCSLIKTKRCRHCNICNRCVERYDHHCPWINNCVGVKNHGYFYAYIISLQIYMFAIFYLLIMRLRERIRDKVPFSQMDPYDAIIATFSQIFSFGIQNGNTMESVLNMCSFLLIIVCMLFLVPLMILICVQTKNMMTNETTSERFSKKKEQSSSSSSGALTHQEALLLEEQDAQPLNNQNDSQGKDDRSCLSKIIGNCTTMSCGVKEVERQEDLLMKNQIIV